MIRENLTHIQSDFAYGIDKLDLMNNIGEKFRTGMPSKGGDEINEAEC